jgi:hypothetical protein
LFCFLPFRAAARFAKRDLVSELSLVFSEVVFDIVRLKAGLVLVVLPVCRSASVELFLP